MEQGLNSLRVLAINAMTYTIASHRSRYSLISVQIQLCTDPYTRIDNLSRHLRTEKALAYESQPLALIISRHRLVVDGFGDYEDITEHRHYRTVYIDLLMFEDP